jgi:hypothetical protein
MDRRELRERLLAFIPRDHYVFASDVVASSQLPANRVWPELVLLAQDGVISTEYTGRSGPHVGDAKIRRDV